jgi:nucleoid DNA-binding protein
VIVTRTELTAEIFRRLPPFYRLKLPRSVLNMVIDNMFDIIIEQLMIGEPVQIRGYGVLDPKVSRGRRHRDKDTNEIKETKPYLRVTFRLSRKWRDVAKKMIRGE